MDITKFGALGAIFGKHSLLLSAAVERAANPIIPVPPGIPTGEFHHGVPVYKYDHRKHNRSCYDPNTEERKHIRQSFLTIGKMKEGQQS